MYTCNSDQQRYLAQGRYTYDLVIGSVDFGGLRFAHFMVRYSVDPQNQILLECPCCHVFGELDVSGFPATKGQGLVMVINPYKTPHLSVLFLAKSSLNSSTPPTQVARAPLRVWKPVTRLKELPAQRPSPPLSAASNTESAPESAVASEAKLSAGARRMGKRSGLFPSAAGIPENHTGGKSDPTMILGCGVIGIMVAGSSRSGEWETRGVCGGGRMRENSFARELTRFCF